MIAPCFYVTKKGVMPAKNFCPRSHGFRGALCKGEIKLYLWHHRRGGVFLKVER